MMSRILDWFLGPRLPAAPVLRNVVGGMAWIRGVDGVTGAAQLNNRAVKTVRVRDGKWEIEPTQFFIARQSFLWDGVLYLEGQAVGVCAVVDECLEPWKDTGLRDDEVADLYEPDRLIAKPATASAIRGH